MDEQRKGKYERLIKLADRLSDKHWILASLADNDNKRYLHVMRYIRCNEWANCLKAQMQEESNV